MNSARYHLRLALSVSLVAICRASQNGGGADPLIQQPPGFLQPDPFVQAAPLVVAAVCQEGVVLLATHTDDDTESLLYQDIVADSTESMVANSDNNDDNALRDLPRSYGGPWRIHTVAPNTHMMCAGWRADGDLLVERAQDMARAERTRFGNSSGVMSSFLATQLAAFLARCALTRRSLSTAALLAGPPPNDTDSKSGLWLVDCTGAYPVRAFCLGGGDCDDASSKVAKSTADAVNARLVHINFAEMTGREALHKILQQLLGCDVDSTNVPATPLVKAGTRVEMAVLGRATSPALTRWRYCDVRDKKLAGP